jgi:hypothetical protein
MRHHYRLILLILGAFLAGAPFSPLHAEQFCSNVFQSCSTPSLTLNTPTLGNGTHLSIYNTDPLAAATLDYAVVRVINTPSALAADSVDAGVWATTTNTVSTNNTIGHDIGVFGVCTDNTAGRRTCYGVEGRSQGVSTAAARDEAYYGVTGQTHVQAASFANTAFAIGVEGLVDITTDGSTPLANGLAYSFYAPAIVGGAAGSKFSFLGSDPIRTTGGLQTPGAGSASTVHGLSAAAGGTLAIAIGDSSSSGAAGGVALGNSSLIAAGHTGSVALGYASTTSAAQQLVSGSSTANLAYINHVYIGSGVTDTTAQSVTYHATGGSGSNNAGGNLTMAMGAGTGTAAGSQVSLSRSLMTTTGSTAQTQVPGFTVCETKTLSNTSATATTLAQIGAASNSGGGATVFLSVTATDGTNFDTETQSTNLSFVNKAGVFTISTPTTTASSAASNSGSTTIGFTATGASSLISLKVTPVFGTIVPTTVTGYITIINQSTGAVTCL